MRRGLDDSSAGPPLVRLLDHPQVDEGLGLSDALDRSEALGQEAQQRLVVLADGLDQQVVRARSDHDVVDFGHLGDLFGDRHEAVALAADTDHRHLLEAELERVGDADDLEDAALDEAVRARPDRSLAHAELGGDLGVGATAVSLEVLDDPLVELRDLLARATTHGPRSGARLERHADRVRRRGLRAYGCRRARRRVSWRPAAESAVRPWASASGSWRASATSQAPRRAPSMARPWVWAWLRRAGSAP